VQAVETSEHIERRAEARIANSKMSKIILGSLQTQEEEPQHESKAKAAVR
jgi:hypothetical protein